MNLAALDAAIKSAGIPIDGVSGTKDTTIQFRPEATDEQRAAAQAILAGWDRSAEAEAARLATAKASQVASLIQSTDAVPLAVRAVVAAVVRCINRRHPDDPITEAEIFAEISA